jgi:signal transduction histidine kinase/ActR/RegA family two-component response regulator
MVSFQLVSIFTRLQSPSTRQAGAAELALLTGAEQVLLFGKDHEIDVYLPAPGMPQTLRGGALWQRFLAQCRQHGGAVRKLPALNGDREVTAEAMIAPDGTAIIVFIDGAPAATERDAIAALLPLIGATLTFERSAVAAGGSVQAERDFSRRAGALNAALDINRRELQTAYERAERELVFRREAEQRLRDADRRKDEFLAMLAHELRNPLAPISMAAQILKLGTVSQQRLQQTSQIIDRQVSHMTSLLDDLLDVSRVTGGRVTLAQDMHDMRAIVRDAVEQARPAIIARHHHLSITLASEAVHVCGDGTRLVQIITNLLNNAGKYTPQGGKISLVLEVAGDHVDVLVRDNGIGISADLLPHVFDLFTQGERSPDRAQGGLGLGLALAKSLVERHGGTLSAASMGAGQGSLFTVRLPRAKGLVIADDAPCESHTLDHAHTGLEVLIVDDNADAAHTLSLYLEAVGHKVRVAFDGIGALKIVGESAPQVLLLDIGLPDIDGHDLARSLRAMPQTARAIFIALTGYGTPEDRARSREAGFDYHLTKPVDPGELARVLTELKQAQAA